MRRALELARNGYGYVSPNPMVGAVIVRDGRVIGEGYHRVFGGPHAEVCAVRSVESDELLRGATIYVTLEPCSHFGKTPPCAALLVDKGFGRVVVGCVDPNERVSGRGIAMLREAGIDVTVGVLERECRELNVKFFTAHTLRRPYVLLKWACSSDGYLDRRRDSSQPAARFSTPATSLLVQDLRRGYDAIMVGSGTVIADNPRLTLRGLPGRQPVRVVVDRRGAVPADAGLFAQEGKVIYFTSELRNDLPHNVVQERVATDAGPHEFLELLYSRHGVTSLMVEGGASLLGSFIESGLWDQARVEVSPMKLGSEGVARIRRPEGCESFDSIDGNTVITVRP